jgi:hypothetical protein
VRAILRNFFYVSLEFAQSLSQVNTKSRIYTGNPWRFFQEKHGYFFSDVVSDNIRVLFFFNKKMDYPWRIV